jgi:hypothetical protein
MFGAADASRNAPRFRRESSAFRMEMNGGRPAAQLPLNDVWSKCPAHLQESETMKRFVIAGAVAAGLALGAAPASAGDRGIGPGGAAALGVLGGLAIGGAIASGGNNGYYPGKPVYVAPPPEPVYVERPRRVYVEPDCFVQRRRYVDEFGDVVVRRVRVCD